MKQTQKNKPHKVVKTKEKGKGNIKPFPSYKRFTSINEIEELIINDLHSLQIEQTHDNQYYFNLIVGNLKDLFKELRKYKMKGGLR